MQHVLPIPLYRVSKFNYEILLACFVAKKNTIEIACIHSSVQFYFRRKLQPTCFIKFDSQPLLPTSDYFHHKNQRCEKTNWKRIFMEVVYLELYFIFFYNPSPFYQIGVRVNWNLIVLIYYLCLPWCRLLTSKLSCKIPI